MTRREARDETGAALILAIAFLVVVGGIATAILSGITTGTQDRVVLDRVRDRQYAADGAIEFAIAQVRGLGAPSAGLLKCNGLDRTLNDIAVHVDCAPAATVNDSGFLQRNVIFAACEGAGPCTDATTIIRAQVNYESVGAPPHIQVKRTWVQSWSVTK